MAAVDFFIKFDGIKGESADAKHKDEIDVESWSWGETHAGGGGVGGGGGAGKVSMQDFQFMMRLNRASPALMKACATGQHIKDGDALGPQGRQGPAGVPDLQVPGRPRQLVPVGRSGGARRPDRSVSFSFAKIEVEYKPQKADGSLGSPVAFRYDLKTNKTF